MQKKFCNEGCFGVRSGRGWEGSVFCARPWEQILESHGNACVVGVSERDDVRAHRGVQGQRRCHQRADALQQDHRHDRAQQGQDYLKVMTLKLTGRTGKGVSRQLTLCRFQIHAIEKKFCLSKEQVH